MGKMFKTLTKTEKICQKGGFVIWFYDRIWLTTHGGGCNIKQREVCKDVCIDVLRGFEIHHAVRAKKLK